MIRLIIISLLLTSCAIYYDSSKINTFIPNVEVDKRPVVELAVTFKEIDWNGKSTGNVETVQSIARKEYRKFIYAGRSPYENSNAFKKVLRPGGTFTDKKIDYRIHLNLISDMRGSLLRNTWHWMSHLTLAVIPYRMEYKYGYELIVYDNKQNEIKRLKKFIPMVYWQSILFIYKGTRIEEMKEGINKIARMSLRDLVKSKVIH